MDYTTDFQLLPLASRLPALASVTPVADQTRRATMPSRAHGCLVSEDIPAVGGLLGADGACFAALLAIATMHIWMHRLIVG